jgi:hypothetical protein
MKTVCLVLAALFLTGFLYRQQALSFSEAKEKNIRVSLLDSTYASGIHSDTSLAVFKNNQDEFISAYQQLLKDLGKYLEANDFAWEKPTKGFNRIYFNEKGKIDYFLYSFRPDQLTPEKEKRFGELLNKFIADYQFPLKAKVKFAQCSPVTYMPAEK